MAPETGTTYLNIAYIANLDIVDGVITLFGIAKSCGILWPNTPFRQSLVASIGGYPVHWIREGHDADFAAFIQALYDWPCWGLPDHKGAIGGSCVICIESGTDERFWYAGVPQPAFAQSMFPGGYQREGAGQAIVEGTFQMVNDQGGNYQLQTGQQGTEQQGDGQQLGSGVAASQLPQEMDYEMEQPTNPQQQPDNNQAAPQGGLQPSTNDQQGSGQNQ